MKGKNRKGKKKWTRLMVLTPGTVRGHLTVLEPVKNRMVLCRCECGVERLFHARPVKVKPDPSCGCVSRAEKARIKWRHGEGMRGQTSKEYRALRGMIARCHNPNSEEYHNYGARGISVCGRWRESFAAFLADVGRAPSSEHSVDRINNDGDYEPGNVRWATRSQQMNNRRGNHKVSIGGDTRTIAEWAEYSGIDSGVLWYRVHRGWPTELLFAPALAVRNGSPTKISIARRMGLSKVPSSREGRARFYAAKTEMEATQ